MATRPEVRCQATTTTGCWRINYTLTGAIDQTDGIVCFHERTAIEVADRVATALFQERNSAFLQRFYYD